ncbi:amino acid/amide ABC transporter ATP-binding protein 2, HAAT family [Noviherbaspirillum humi]|uniref:Amino acid/amide ABC transporter ATP-binding protein 2, HAAT family n=1 Tax=Noviherbaspirillum humi TaxID=1688639 RepID=A0A239LAI3_9BURK|nr:ABC transporter ATP-binding protein [Noviherbaspirillum humi]SNT27667.1 amino acid/amide ABC transporter ATP-binding protein 2, HAAT family [Noviherbaspirillum humi]
MDKLLTIDGLRAGYKDAVVIDGLSLAIDRGECMALLGRNGVGKTTLLATLMGLTNVFEGSIRLGGTDLRPLSAYQRNQAGLGFVPQEREIFPSLTVEQNLRVAQRPGPWNVQEVFNLFPRLQERRGNFGNQLSGGEQQMLAMGRALVGNPSLLLLDEPLEGLSPIIMDVLLDSIKALKASGLTLILVEQHAHLALEVTDNVVVLDRGRIVHQGSSEAFLADEARMSSLLGLAQSDLSATA